MTAGPLVGREGELQAIAGVLVGVRERGAMIVRGDAGIGKSALLARRAGGVGTRAPGGTGPACGSTTTWPS
jgi:hypothetical protein